MFTEMMYCHYQQVHAIFANKTTFGPNHKQLITFKTIAHDASSCAKKYGIYLLGNNWIVLTLKSAFNMWPAADIIKNSAISIV